MIGKGRYRREILTGVFAEPRHEECNLVVTGQETSYPQETYPAVVMADDDGALQKGLSRDFSVLDTGPQAGTFAITINNKTHNLSNNIVRDNRVRQNGERLEWARYVPTADIGPAADGKLFWEQWTLTNKTDISFTALVGADVLGGNGDCATDFFDSKGTGWTHDAGNGEYDCDGSQVATTSLAEWAVTAVGTTYKVTWILKNYGAGNVRVMCGSSGGGTWRSANNTYTEFITCAGNTAFYIQANADFIGSVDDITVEPVTGGEIASAASEFDTGACCVGRIVLPSGSTSNDRNYTVTATTAAKLTVSETSIIDEAAGATITIATVDDTIFDLAREANSGTGLGGYTDWRVPNLRELESLYDLESQPVIDGTAFPSTPIEYHWTSSTRKDGSTNGYAVYFGNYLYSKVYGKTTLKYYCRLVRGG